MAKANVLVSAAGWLLGFTEKLVAELKKRGVTDEAIHGLVTEKGDAAVEKIAEELAKLMRPVKNIYRLLKIADGRTTEELVKDGKYDYANPDINSKNFPARARKEKSEEIVFIEGKDFDHDPTSEEVLAEAKRRGLERPVYEDSLYFGEEHPEVQRQGPVVFLHEPWRDSDGDLRVVYLWSYVVFRLLYLNYFSSRWSRYCRFAFVRK